MVLVLAAFVSSLQPARKHPALRIIVISRVRSCSINPYRYCHQLKPATSRDCAPAHSSISGTKVLTSVYCSSSQFGRCQIV